MKAVLDHVGIGVERLDEALAFYRDALGLDVSPVHDVAGEHVRTVFVPVGESSLELLEAAGPGSAIAKFVARHGPGLHHITLAVDDLTAALDELRSRGVRLIDEVPRSGAHGSRVAFVHPSATGGVLLELKERAPGLGTSR